MRPMKPRDPGSPHEALASFMAEIAATQGEAPGFGVKIAADFEGKSPGALYKELDPDQREQMPYTRVARLTAHFRVTAMAEDLALRAGGVFVLPAPVHAADSDEQGLLKIARETTEVVAEGWAARAGGRLNLAERTQLRRGVRAAIAALLEFDARLASEDEP